MAEEEASGPRRPVLVALGGAALLLLALAAVSPVAYRSVQRRRRVERNRGIVAAAAERLGLERALLEAVAWAESAFDERAVSAKGAVGLLQVMPETGKEVAARLGLEEPDLRDPVDNALIGGAYLKEQLARYGGDLHLALAAYHAGPGSVDAWRAEGAGLPGADVVERFGFESTRKYVASVLRKRDELLRRSGGGEDAEGNARPAALPVIRYAHTVKKGETLSGIAAGACVRVRDVVRLNGLSDAGRIRAGDCLMLRPFPVKEADGGERNLLGDYDAGDVEVTVLKAERRLELRIGGHLVRTCRIALGRRAVGDKEKEGDLKTPLGEFYVCQRLPEGKYGPSLGISYPGAEDAERGLRDGLVTRDEYEAIVSATLARRAPPWKTRLGGAICIHGRGSERDWTLGCIALSDEDASELFALVPMGAVVRILAKRAEEER